jgi:hypothetical protein
MVLLGAAFPIVMHCTAASDSRHDSRTSACGSVLRGPQLEGEQQRSSAANIGPRIDRWPLTCRAAVGSRSPYTMGMLDGRCRQWRRAEKPAVARTGTESAARLAVAEQQRPTVDVERLTLRSEVRAIHAFLVCADWEGVLVLLSPRTTSNA